MDKASPREDSTIQASGPFRAFSHPGYRLLWFVGASRHSATWMEITILGWLTFELTSSPFQVVLLGVYRYLPMALLGPLSGIVADRVSRKQVIQLAAAISIAASSTLAFLMLFDLVSVWNIGLITLVLGSCAAFEFPARRALLRDMVGQRLLVNALSLDVAGMTLSLVGGPLLAGGLLEIAEVGQAFSVVVFVYSLLFFALLAIPGDVPPQSSSHKLWSDLGQAISYMRSNRAIMGVLVTTVFINVLAIPFLQFLPVFAKEILGVGPGLLGAMTSFFGLGTFVGSMVLASINIGRPGVTFLGATVLVAIALMAFAVSREYALSVFLISIVGLGNAGFVVFQSSLMLVNTPEEYRARVMGLLSVAIGLGILGAFLQGLLAKWIDVPWVVGLAATSLLVSLPLVALIYRPLLRQRA